MLTTALILALSSQPAGLFVAHADAPRRAQLLPAALPASGARLAESSARPLPVASLTLGGAGVVFIGAGVALLISGLATRNALDRTVTGGVSTLRGSDARALNDSAAIQLGLAGASGVVALALGGTALALW